MEWHKATSEADVDNFTSGSVMLSVLSIIILEFITAEGVYLPSSSL